MPDVFQDYARYYDLLYRDKDYAREAAYVHGLIQAHRPGAGTLLDLGCGTGRHDACFQRTGYAVVGVDLSETMLARARELTMPGKLEFRSGDVRSVVVPGKFDAAVSLFHVMSYQTTEEDVLAAMRTAHRHLVDDGVFIFDFWHAAGVMKDPPALRVKRLEDKDVKIIRIAEPVMHPGRPVIDVNYQIITLDKASGQGRELRETHVMRYFSLNELDRFLSTAGFSVKGAWAWLTAEPLSSAWYGIVIAQKSA